MVVGDDELHVHPINRFVEQLDALLQQVQAVAGRDDDRHRQFGKNTGSARN